MGVGKEGSQARVSFGQGLTHQGQLLGRQCCRQAVRRSEGTWGEMLGQLALHQKSQLCVSPRQAE